MDQKLLDTLLNGFAGGIDHDVISVPGVILPIKNILPGRQLQAGYVRRARFDPFSMFDLI